MDLTILGKLIQSYLFLFTGTVQYTLADALHFLRLLVTLDIILLGLWWSMSEDNLVGVVLTKILFVGTLTWLLTTWTHLIPQFQESFVRWGIVAGGSALTPQDFQSPGSLFGYGLQVGVVLIQSVTSVSGWNVLFHAPVLSITGAVGLAIVLAFAVMTLQVVMTMLVFYLNASLAILLLPLAAFRSLAYLSERALGAVVANGVKLSVLAFLASGVQASATFLQPPPNPTIPQLLSLSIGVGFIGMLAWKGPEIAMGLLQGAPVLSASSALQTGLAMGAQAGAVAGGVLAGTGSAVRGLMASGREIQGLGRAVQAGGLAGASRYALTRSQDLARATVARLTAPQTRLLPLPMSRMVP